MTSPMTPEDLSALADKLARWDASTLRFYFLVPKRQLLPPWLPMSEELKPGSPRSGRWATGGRVGELSKT